MYWRPAGLLALLCLAMVAVACDAGTGSSDVTGSTDVSDATVGEDGAVPADSTGSPDATDSPDGVDPVDSSDGPVDCAAGQIACLGVCIDPLTSVDHCGAMDDCVGANAGFACAAGDACVSGACAATCAPGQVLCGGACVDPGTDAAWCGATGDCAGANAGESCAAGATCVAGSCSCGVDEGLCNGACAPLADVGGACDGGGACCADGLTCQGGECACAPGTELCGGGCVDTTASVDHCGECDDPCEAGHACIDSECAGITFAGALPATAAKWNYQNILGMQGAVDACAANFPTSAVCTDSDLVWLSPGGTMASATDLDGETVSSFWSVEPDPADFPPGEDWNPSCDGWAHESGDIGPGGAWRPLDTVTGAVGSLEMDACSDMRSVGCCITVGDTPPACPGGLVECGGECIDPETHADHCGASAGCEGDAAGEVCGEDALCLAGVCEISCTGGEIACGGGCVDPTTDSSWCGATSDCAGDNAGEACSGGATCVGGACACSDGLDPCGGSCVDLDTSEDHCGGCDAPCDPGQACGGGGCWYITYVGSLPATTAKWNYQNVLGMQGAVDACDANFPGATVCTDAHLVWLGPGGTMTGAVDTGAVQVASFWSVGADPTELPDGDWNPSCDGWAHGSGDIGPGGAYRPLDGSTGAIGDLGINACFDVRWVGCCLVDADPPPACPDGQVQCAGTCIHPDSSDAWCGASGDCEGANAGDACGDSEQCTAGVCEECPGGGSLCGGTCVDTDTSSTHCGDCDSPCDAPKTCSAGQCLWTSYEGALPGTSAKWNFQNVLGFDGAADFCDTNFTGSTVCTDAELVWLGPGGTMAGAHDIDGVEVTSFWSVEPDPADIPAGKEDWNASCDDWAHQSGDIGDGGAFRPLDAVSGAVGALDLDACYETRWVGCCGLTDEPPPACGGGQVECGGGCIAPATDNMYCGASGDCQGAAAGSACTAGETCVGGTCESICSGDEEYCGGCVDTTSSGDHCGGCDAPCDAGQACQDSDCVYVSYEGALPQTSAKWNFQNVLGFQGAEDFCDTHFPGAGVCTDADLVWLGPGGTMTGAHDIDGLEVTSFWSVDPAPADVPAGKEDWNASCDGWAHQSGDIGDGGAFRPLDGGDGSIGALDLDVCYASRWVGCCRVSPDPPPPCPGAQVQCGGECVEPASDDAWCGASGDCEGDADGAVCGDGEQCVAGVCEPDGPLFMGALPQTGAKWNFQNVLGFQGAADFCDANFTGSTVCTDTDLVWLGPGGTMAAAEDIDGVPVTSFWSVDPDPADIPAGKEDWNASCDNWAHQSGDIGDGGAYRPLDGVTGAVGALDLDVCYEPRWVGCCLPGG